VSVEDVHLAAAYDGIGGAGTVPRMERVRGIGGFFFKARDPKALSAWYRDALGIAIEDWGGAIFRWDKLDARGGAATVWSPFAADTTYFAPSDRPYMINFVVDDLDAIRAQVKAAGGTVDDKTTDDFNGRFGWVMDPEGNRVELWEPRTPASE
jgi:predicted enzyme related to lactoylglutathione lyase